MPGVTLGATFRDGHERGLGDPSGRLYPPGGEASQAWQSGSAGLSTAGLSRKPSLLLRASVGSTEAPEKDFCGSMRFCTLVTLDP